MVLGMFQALLMELLEYQNRQADMYLICEYIGVFHAPQHAASSPVM